MSYRGYQLPLLMSYLLSDNVWERYKRAAENFFFVKIVLRAEPRAGSIPTRTFFKRVGVDI